MTLIRDDPAIPNDATVEVSLPHDASAAGRARGSVRSTLTGWHLPLLLDVCALAVSELVTNAVRHGRPPIAMLMSRSAGGVRIDVRDSDPAPMPQSAGRDEQDLAESGRGLDIVRQVADDSGEERIPGDGKTVFASWRLEPADATTDNDRAP